LKNGKGDLGRMLAVRPRAGDGVDGAWFRGDCGEEEYDSLRQAGMGVALSLGCGVALIRDGFGEWPWKPKFFGVSVLERSRVGGEEWKLGLAEFGAEIDLRSPSRYGEYPVLGRSARWSR
jgi:hypothetical protein